MPIAQNRGEKFLFKRYRYYKQAFQDKAIVSQWLHRHTTIRIFMWKTTLRRFESWHVIFFFCFFFFFLSVNVLKCDEGFAHFLHIIAKSPSAFYKINEPMLDEANRRY